jgi:hypothetical protein
LPSRNNIDAASVIDGAKEELNLEMISTEMPLPLTNNAKVHRC